MSSAATDQIEFLIEMYTYWRDLLDFHRASIPARVPDTEREVTRLQQELAAYGATFDTNGGVKWPETDKF